MTRISKTISNNIATDFMQKALKWSQNFDEMVFLESNKDTQAKQEKYGEIDAILAFGAQHFLSTDSDGAFDKLKKFRQKHKDFLFGYLSYDLKNDTEDLNSWNPDHLDFPELFFFQPRKVILWKNDIVEFLYLEEYQDEIEKDLKEIGQVKLQSELPLNNCKISSRLSKNDYF